MRDARPMVWTLEQVRRAFFALTIFALPWQTRWFNEGPPLGGYPWEQGRISVYASWFLILASVLIRLYHLSCDPSGAPSFAILLTKSRIWYQQLNKKYVLFLIPVGAILLHTISPRATLEWSLEWFLLLGFVWSIQDLRLTRREVMLYFTIALVPHALLGIGQYLSQVVIGSKWLGVATQFPVTRGVSIVQVGSQRILRAYGGFPHPNIFGAWLAIGILGIIDQTRQILTRRCQMFYVVCLAIFSSALILTFSRGAWLMLIFGGVTYLIFLLKQQGKEFFKERVFLLSMLIAGLGMLFMGIFVRDRIFVRLHPQQTRLEEKSIDERAVGLKNGWEVFKTHPFLGSGPGTILLAISERSQVILTEPPVPPHFIPLILLAELGMMGVLILSGMLFLLRRRIGTVFSRDPMILGVGVEIVLLLGSVDHFLWTTWSGKVATVLLLVLSF